MPARRGREGEFVTFRILTRFNRIREERMELCVGQYAWSPFVLKKHLIMGLDKFYI